MNKRAEAALIWRILCSSNSSSVQQVLRKVVVQILLTGKVRGLADAPAAAVFSVLLYYCLVSPVGLFLGSGGC